MKDTQFTRRDFLRAAGVLSAMTAFGEIPSNLFASDERRLVRFP